VLERTPPELAADIVDRGVVLTGGGSQLKNLDVLLREETGLPVMVSDSPECAVVLGTGRALDEHAHPGLAGAGGLLLYGRVAATEA